MQTQTHTLGLTSRGPVPYVRAHRAPSQGRIQKSDLLPPSSKTLTTHFAIKLSSTLIENLSNTGCQGMVGDTVDVMGFRLFSRTILKTLTANVIHTPHIQRRRCFALEAAPVLSATCCPLSRYLTRTTLVPSPVLLPYLLFIFFIYNLCPFCTVASSLPLSSSSSLHLF